MGAFRILLGNYNSIFRQGVRSFLLDKRDCTVVGEAATKCQLFTESQRLRPELLTLDADVDCQSAKQLFKSYQNVFSGTRIIFFLNTNEERYCKHLLKLNAAAYLSYGDGKEDIHEAIDAIRKRDHFVSDTIKSLILECYLPGKEKPAMPRLSRREKEILDLIANEFVTAEIAESLFISKHTVETHRKHLLSKFNARNTAGLVKYAVENGLVS